MSPFLAGAGQILPAVIALALATVVWPGLFVPTRSRRRLPTLTLVLAALALWVALDIVLAAVRAAEFATLAAAAVAIPVAVRARARRVAPPGATAQAPSLLAVGLDLFEAPPAVAAGRTGAAMRAWARARMRVVAGHLRRPADALLAAALGAVLVWHLLPYLSQAAPGTPLGYQWLLSTKMVGLNQGLWSGGVVAPGLPALVSAMHSLFSIDMLNWLRLAPPLAALLAATGAAALAETLTGSRWAAVICAVAVGLTHVPAVGNPQWSPTDPLVPQLAAGFVLIWGAATVHAVRAPKSANRTALWSAAFLAGSFDPALAGIGVALTLLVGVVAREDRQARQAVLGSAIAAALPALVPVLGLVTGHHAVANLWQETAGQAPVAMRLAVLWPALAAGAAVTVHRLVWPAAFTRRRERAMAAFAAALLAVAVLLLAAPAALAAGPLHTGIAAMAAMPLAAAWLLSFGLRRRPRAVAGTALLAAFTLVMTILAGPQALSRSQARGSATAYLRIAASYPKYTWTIVSPTTAYPEVLGSGWHTELSQFVRDDTVAQAADPRFRPADDRALAIRTPDVFVFVDIRPTYLDRAVTPADARLPLPPPADSNPYQGQYGATIEGRALLWARAYLRAHPGTASVYAENPDLLVIRIRQ